MNFNTTYQPETDGKTKRVNHVLEDMLRMYVMDKPSKLEDYRHLVEFSYKTRYQVSLNMTPFEALYGRNCNTPVSWDNPTDRAVVGENILQELEEKMVKIRNNLKVSQVMKKSYDDKGRIHGEFKVSYHVFLKVKARCSSLKLVVCYCVPFQIL
jgi:hypothetical protein